MNGLLSKFGDGVLATGAPSVPGKAKSQIHAGAPMPVQGQRVVRAVNHAVPKPSGGAASAQFNNTQGAATGQVNNFNPNQDFNPGAAQEFYANEELKDSGLSKKAVAAFDKAYNANKKTVDGNWLMAAAKVMKEYPGAVDAGEGIVTGLTAGGTGYAAYKAYERMQLAKATGGGPASADAATDAATPEDGPRIVNQYGKPFEPATSGGTAAGDAAGDAGTDAAGALADEGGSAVLDLGAGDVLGPAYVVYKAATYSVGNSNLYTGKQLARHFAPKPKDGDKSQ